MIITITISKKSNFVGRFSSINHDGFQKLSTSFSSIFRACQKKLIGENIPVHGPRITNGIKKKRQFRQMLIFPYLSPQYIVISVPSGNRTASAADFLASHFFLMDNIMAGLTDSMSYQRTMALVVEIYS